VEIIIADAVTATLISTTRIATTWAPINRVTSRSHRPCLETLMNSAPVASDTTADVVNNWIISGTSCAGRWRKITDTASATATAMTTASATSAIRLKSGEERISVAMFEPQAASHSSTV
jgi:hypothetical protein